MLKAISVFLSGKFWWVYVIIFFGKLIEVSLSTLRTQLIVKGEKFFGSIVAAGEYAFWIVITASALDDFASDPLKIIVLICAFSLGQALGGFFEEKLALGTCTINAVFSLREDADRAADLLRANGFALTLFAAEGREHASRTVIMLTLRRRTVRFAIKLIRSAAPGAVISTAQSIALDGGTLCRAGSKLFK